MVIIFDLLAWLEKGAKYRVNDRGTEYLTNDNDLIIAKKCRKCNKWRMSEEYNKEKRGLGGRRSCCKECRKQYLRQWHEINEDHSKEYRRNRVSIYRENKIRWRKKNPEKHKKQEYIYREKNRDKIRLIDARREARKKLLPQEMTDDELKNTLQYFNYRCALTGEGIEGTHLDHVVPLATGHGGTVYGNMIPLTASLNTSKNDTNIFEWFETNRQRFELSQDKFDRLIGFLAEANEMSIEEYCDYVYWCFENQRNIDEIEADNKRYGCKKPSAEIWRESKVIV